MERTIFREYDIRGVVGKDLEAESVFKIARGFAAYCSRKGVKKLSLGRDVRLSSPDFREAMIRGLTSSGLDVVDIGVVPTPLLYFSIVELQTDGGVMITGSHNPPEYNGFKLCVGTTAIYGEMIQEVREVIERAEFMDGEGSLRNEDVIPLYIEKIKDNVKIEGKVRAVVDCGNGTAGLVAPSLFREIGVDVIPLFEEPDGNFPNHFPDPTVPENLEKLIEKVKETGADVGVGYDGDADRIGVVDERGNVIFGDYLLVIFSRELLTRKPGATIISEVKASQNLFDDIRKHGGNPVMFKTGHSLIKNKMKDVGAELAGEMSGHIFFKDRYYGFDDAIYASARLFEILSKAKDPLSYLLSDLPDLFSTPEIRMECPDEDKFAVVDEVRKLLSPEAKEVITIDGVRALFDGGWGLVRASNTQPVLVLRYEGVSEAEVEKIRSTVLKAVKAAMEARKARD
ncbi:MAG: phosphomannomutase [Deltaproteobacteria bacterium]|nr:phosphomannomutase [Deltaproteobacteria bacterium]NIS77600.1 phosphomannomutase [Deltaproteobacteria bacterium]